MGNGICLPDIDIIYSRLLKNEEAAWWLEDVIVNEYNVIIFILLNTYVKVITYLLHILDIAKKYYVSYFLFVFRDL